MTELKGVTGGEEGYKGLEGVTRGTGDDRGLQRVTECYKA